MKENKSDKQDCLIVFARPPEPGKVKTRISAEVGEEKALYVYQKLFNNTINSMEDLNKSINKVLAWTKIPANLTDFPDWEHWLQPSLDLGNRMAWAINNSIVFGFDRSVVIGTDLPAINAEIIERAFETLKGVEVVLGPASDGGYYLVGTKRNIPALFPELEWGCTDVFRGTIESLQKANVPYRLLETHSDVDYWDDWMKWSDKLNTLRE